MSATVPLDNQAETVRHIVDGVPNWEAIDFDLHCSRCGYNLRMLSRPKCTECGFEFEWRELISRRFTLNAKLFEHNWRKRPIRSYLRAIVLPALAPTRYWRGVSLHDKIELRPLLFLIATAPLVLLIVLFGGAWIQSELLDWIYRFSWGLMFRTALGYQPVTSVNSAPLLASSEPVRVFLYGVYLGEKDFLRSFTFRSSDQWILGGSVLIGIIAIAMTLSSLKETIAKSKLLPGHMVRVVAYAATPACLLVAIVVHAMIWADGILEFHGKSTDYSDVIGIGLVSCLVLLLLNQLYVPLKRYLSIPTPLLAAFLVGVIGVLSGGIGVFFLSDLMR